MSGVSNVSAPQYGGANHPLVLGTGGPGVEDPCNVGGGSVEAQTEARRAEPEAPTTEADLVELAAQRAAEIAADRAAEKLVFCPTTGV